MGNVSTKLAKGFRMSHHTTEGANLNFGRHAKTEERALGKLFFEVVPTRKIVSGVPKANFGVRFDGAPFTLFAKPQSRWH
jgi:hypothetical protein